MKLKQIDPRLLCMETLPGDNQTDPTNPVDPIPIRTKPDATTTCHTYLFPQIRMDCSNRGKFTIRFPLKEFYLQHQTKFGLNEMLILMLL